MDFLQLYLFYFIMGVYYVWNANDYDHFYFSNETIRRAFLAFVILHAIFTFIPPLIFLLIRINKDFRYRHSDRSINLFTKFSLCFYNFFQLYWLRLAFGPSLSIDYRSQEDQKVVYTLSRGVQILFHATLITLICINNSSMDDAI